MEDGDLMEGWKLPHETNATPWRSTTPWRFAALEKTNSIPWTSSLTKQRPWRNISARPQPDFLDAFKRARASRGISAPPRKQPHDGSETSVPPSYQTLSRRSSPARNPSTTTRRMTPTPRGTSPSTPPRRPISPAVDLSRQQAFDHLEDLRERGALDHRQDPDDGRRVVWRDDGLHRVGDHGEADLQAVDLEDLDEEEVRRLARSSIYTWEFTNCAAEDADPTAARSGGPADNPRPAVNGGDRPPDDAD